jgi:hypothetical protein
MTIGKTRFPRVPVKAVEELVKQNGNAASNKGKGSSGVSLAKKTKRVRAVQSRGA